MHLLYVNITGSNLRQKEDEKIHILSCQAYSSVIVRSLKVQIMCYLTLLVTALKVAHEGGINAIVALKPQIPATLPTHELE
jgi:hypothetical protein